MDTKNNVLIIGLLTLVVGLGLGYYVGMSKAAPAPMAAQPQAMNHDMGSTMDGMIASLQGKTGDEFDKAFLTGMIAHHQGAVAMAQAALQNANHKEIKQMAQNIISAQTSEISQMQQWQKEWFNQ